MLHASLYGGVDSPLLMQALEASLASLATRPRRFAVAVSGGADSSMLAVHAADYARRNGLALHFLHVHHGLQTSAEAWQKHVHDLAYRLQVPCHSLRASVDLSRGGGIESAARDARYQALAELAAHAGVRHILLAHHRKDQAETVLLRLLRGAGPTGLAAMARSTERSGLMYLRPWLDVDRHLILEAAQVFTHRSGWAPVIDPTNIDDRYTRAALRTRVIPALDERWPGWQSTLLRHARQSAEVAEVLSEVAAEALAGLDPSDDGSSFSLANWRALSSARQALVLRHWLATLGMRMPSDARLQDVMRQLKTLHALGHDRQMKVKHENSFIRCCRGRVWLDQSLS